MALLWQCVVGCLLFTVVLIPAARRPERYISMYPPGVGAAVRAMPEYAGLPREKNGRLMGMAVQGALFTVAGVVLCLLAGKTGFGEAFRHMLVFFMAIDVYDLLVVDWIFFVRLRAFRIPGTEERDDLYKDYGYHFKVFLRGLALGVLAALATGTIVWRMTR